MKNLWILGSQFFILSLMAVGGASATLPEMQRVFVNDLHLMNQTEFSNLFALSQAAPGPNVLFVALFGLQIAGLPGALVSMLAMCVPTLLIAIAVEHYGARYHDSKIYVAVRKSLIPISIGLLLSTAIILLSSSVNYGALAFTFLCVIALWKYHVHPLILIGIGAALGVFGLI